VYVVILPPFDPFFFSLFLSPFFFEANTILSLMQEHNAEARDRLEATFGSKDSKVTLTVRIAKSFRDDSIDIIPSPKKKAGHYQSLLPLFQFTFLGELLPICLVIWALV